MSEAAKGPARKKGRVWKYGDDVNTDVIFPGKYTYTLREPEEIAAHALEDLDPQFAREVQPGDVVVGGRARAERVRPRRSICRRQSSGYSADSLGAAPVEYSDAGSLPRRLRRSLSGVRRQPQRQRL